MKLGKAETAGPHEEQAEVCDCLSHLRPLSLGDLQGKLALWLQGHTHSHLAREVSWELGDLRALPLPTPAREVS